MSDYFSKVCDNLMADGMCKLRPEIDALIALRQEVLDMGGTLYIRAALLERDALKAEVEENNQLIHDLTTDMNDYHDRAEKAEAALAEATDFEKWNYDHIPGYAQMVATRAAREKK